MVSSETVTIPGTVQAGDSCWLLFQGYSGSSGPSTLTLTPSQSAWTQYGTTVYVAGTSSENNAALFYLDAAAADASATVVCHSSVSLFINVTLVVYRSSTGTWTIDTAPSPLSSATLVSTVPTPTGTTTSAGDWVAYFAAICNGSLDTHHVPRLRGRRCGKRTSVLIRVSQRSRTLTLPCPRVPRSGAGRSVLPRPGIMSPGQFRSLRWRFPEYHHHQSPQRIYRNFLFCDTSSDRWHPSIHLVYIVWFSPQLGVPEYVYRCDHRNCHWYTDDN